MEKGGKRRGTGLLQPLGGLRALLLPCRVSGVLVVGLSQSSGE